ncbi:surfeit locus protein 6-domain-containing protein [Trichophaea hybrida]|nr:surfeit locus protein 6-domain-containing protein [Trichophaea hybrida]
MADIEERLKSHSSAFEGLLSLIPANKYFEGDNSSQWNKRKQTKEESKRAKKAKLDPDSATTAAEFRQQQKQKRPHEGDEAEVEVEVAEVEKQPKQKKSKKEKKLKEPPTPKKVATLVNGDNNDTAEKSTPAKSPAKSPAQKKEKGKPSAAAPDPEVAPAPAITSDNDDDDDDEMKDAGEPIQINGFVDLTEQSSPADTPAPTTPAPAAQKPPRPTLSPAARAEQRARLAARIEALRASRKADNIDGSSARTRQELMEARRKKEALRKERKKAARLVAKLSTEEGGAPPTPSATNTNPTPNPVTVVKNFSFGRVMFDDGNQLDASLTDFKKEKRRTGPRDILGQLKHTEAKKRRIENMSEVKKEVVVEKEKWSKALKQATGEKVKDDEKLLKKALKRQEATKRKSSTEWNERLAGQAKAKSLRVKKREENIQARKDQKKAGKSGKKSGAKKGGKSGGKKGGKKPSRPGFEGGMKLSGKGIPNGKGKK